MVSLENRKRTNYITNDSDATWLESAPKKIKVKCPFFSLNTLQWHRNAATA